MRLSLLLLVVLVTTTFAADIRTAKLHLTYTSDEKMNRNVGRLEEVLGALVPEYTGASSLGVLTPAVSLTTVTVTATTVNATTVAATGTVTGAAVTATGAVTGGSLVTTGRLTTGARVLTAGAPQICNANGGGTAATCTVTVGNTYQVIACQDTDGCTPTLSETGAVDGMLWILVGSTSTNTWTFTDSSGVLELSGGTSFAMTPYSVLRLLYVSDRWVEIGRNVNS